MERIRIEHVPTVYEIYAALFTSVSNADFLQSQLAARNTAFEYAFIDASAILSRVHVLASVFRAVTALADGNLRTPNVHSEIVAGLNPSNNVRYEGQESRRRSLTEYDRLQKPIAASESRPGPRISSSSRSSSRSASTRP
jgi:EKC/KEOPS complex subunit CGI121/TPRKB